METSTPTEQHVSKKSLYLAIIIGVLVVVVLLLIYYMREIKTAEVSDYTETHVVTDPELVPSPIATDDLEERGASEIETITIAEEYTVDDMPVADGTVVLGSGEEVRVVGFPVRMVLESVVPFGDTEQFVDDFSLLEGYPLFFELFREERIMVVTSRTAGLEYSITLSIQEINGSELIF